MSILPDLSGKGSVFGCLGWSWSPYSPCPLLSLIPSLVLYVLCCAHLQELEQGTLFPEKCYPTSTRPPSPGASCSSLCMGHVITNNSCLLLPTVLVWLHGHPAISVWDMHINPLSLGMPHHPTSNEHRSKYKEAYQLFGWSHCCFICPDFAERKFREVGNISRSLPNVFWC